MRLKPLEHWNIALEHSMFQSKERIRSLYCWHRRVLYSIRKRLPVLRVTVFYTNWSAGRGPQGNPPK